MASPKYIPYQHHMNLDTQEMIERSAEFRNELGMRRSIRSFDSKPVSGEVLENCIRSAGSAPSGANKQPWHFVVVTDPETKKQIREAAEQEEEQFYAGRAGEEWLNDISHLGTDARKPFLEIAPALIIIFARSYDITEAGDKSKNYYVQESVGIATGMLITALHHCGLATLTHTPSPMGFLSKVLKRPANERAFLILVTGYPAKGVTVPDIKRKSIDEIATFID